MANVPANVSPRNGDIYSFAQNIFAPGARHSQRFVFKFRFAMRMPSPYWAGFVIEEIGEPQPIKPLEGVVFRGYERNMKKPMRLLVRACKHAG